MNGILNFIVSVATTPALLVGLIAMLGLILQKKQQVQLSKVQLKHLQVFGFDWGCGDISYLIESLCNDVSTCL